MCDNSSSYHIISKSIMLDFGGAGCTAQPRMLGNSLSSSDCCSGTYCTSVCQAMRLQSCTTMSGLGTYLIIYWYLTKRINDGGSS